MAIIGTFTRTADGFSGSLKTLTLNSKLQFVPETNKSSDGAPDYRNAPSPEPRKQQGHTSEAAAVPLQAGGQPRRQPPVPARSTSLRC
jgi:hypothetical protein